MLSCIAYATSSLARQHDIKSFDVELHYEKKINSKEGDFYKPTILANIKKGIEVSSNNPFSQKLLAHTLSHKKIASRKQSKASNAAEAAKIAKQSHGGKVLSVNTRKTKKGIVYRVKLLLDNGRVKTVTING